jgi:Ca2+-binding EF-hand superfamily protein
MRLNVVSRAAGVTAGLGISLLGAGTALSQQSLFASIDQKTLQMTLLQNVQSGSTKQTFEQALRTFFVAADADSDGEITQRDVQLHKAMEETQSRAQAIQQAMRYDLDGDGFVTEVEIQRGISYELRSQTSPNAGGNPGPSVRDAIAGQIASRVRAIMSLDADNDGKVSLLEAAKSAKPNRSGGFSARAQQLLELDATSSGVVTLAAYEAMGAKLFHLIDTDRDGVVSQQEMSDYRTRAERAGCEMPMASEKARVILFGSYETETLSNVTLGSQENVVHTGRVNIEPGADPVYVVLTSHAPTIWQFTGATERVERVVLASQSTGPNRSDPGQRPLAGVTGLGKERVTFFNRPNCLPYFYEVPSAGSFQSVGTVRTGTGKTPEVTSAVYEVRSFAAPSGAFISVKKDKNAEPVGPANETITNAPNSEAKSDLFRFSPGGVVDIDPQAVVGSAPAQKYEVMPQQAGLVQLLSSGALVRAKGGEYIVKQKTRFPSGLHGAHSVTFLLPTGVPYPDGDPGHSCVVIEETGLTKGAGCR